jgi:hypothetical protein
MRPHCARAAIEVDGNYRLTALGYLEIAGGHYRGTCQTHPQDRSDSGFKLDNLTLHERTQEMTDPSWNCRQNAYCLTAANANELPFCLNLSVSGEFDVPVTHG